MFYHFLGYVQVGSEGEGGEGPGGGQGGRGVRRSVVQ